MTAKWAKRSERKGLPNRPRENNTVIEFNGERQSQVRVIPSQFTSREAGKVKSRKILPLSLRKKISRQKRPHKKEQPYEKSLGSMRTCSSHLATALCLTENQ